MLLLGECVPTLDQKNRESPDSADKGKVSDLLKSTDLHNILTKYLAIVSDSAVGSSRHALAPHWLEGPGSRTRARLTPCARSTAGTACRARDRSGSASGGTSPGRRRCWGWWPPGTASAWPRAASRSTRGCSGVWPPAAGAGSASQTGAAWRNAAADPASLR